MAETVLTIDARGEACPIPVVRALKALGALAGPGSVETLVDNEIAVQNLTRMGEGKGCSVTSERLGEKEWRVTVTTSVALGVSDAEAESATCEVPVSGAAAARKNVVVAISSECMGVGDDVLGKKLMGSFVYSLTQLDELPACVLLYNGGAHLSCGSTTAARTSAARARRRSRTCAALRPPAWRCSPAAPASTTTASRIRWLWARSPTCT